MKSFRSRESLLIDSVQLESTGSQTPDKGKGSCMADHKPTVSADPNDRTLSPEGDANFVIDDNPQLSKEIVTTEVKAEPVETPDEPDGTHSIVSGLL